MSVRGWKRAAGICVAFGAVAAYVAVAGRSRGALVTVPTIGGLVIVTLLPRWIGGRYRLEYDRRLRICWQAVYFGAIGWALSVTETDRPLWHGAVIAPFFAGACPVLMTWAEAREQRKQLRKAAAASAVAPVSDAVPEDAIPTDPPTSAADR